MLRGYDEIVPGSAERIINAHLENESAGAKALTRLTRAEATGVTIGAIAAPVLAVGGLAGGFVLIIAGYSAVSVLSFVPGILAGLAYVVSAIRGNKA